MEPATPVYSARSDHQSTNPNTRLQLLSINTKYTAKNAEPAAQQD